MLQTRSPDAIKKLLLFIKLKKYCKKLQTFKFCFHFNAQRKTKKKALSCKK